MLDGIRNFARLPIRQLARFINTVSGGRVTPNFITIIGLLAHVFIALLIIQGAVHEAYRSWLIAGISLIVFGLFDTLDGELARLQNRVSPVGMFLDSVTDRMKEIILYAGIGYALLVFAHDTKGCRDELVECLNRFGMTDGTLLLIVILVLGGSLLVSYINAWGEAVLGRVGATRGIINKAFRGGLASFEIRIALIVTGLLTTYLLTAVVVIGVLVGLTIVSRLYKVLSELRRVQN